MLKSVGSIKVLDLYGNGLLISAVLHYAQSRLKQSTVISSVGAVALIEALHATATSTSTPMGMHMLQLHSLNLGANDIGDEAGKAIGDLLRFNTTVCPYLVHVDFCLFFI